MDFHAPGRPKRPGRRAGWLAAACALALGWGPAGRCESAIPPAPPPTTLGQPEYVELVLHSERGGYFTTAEINGHRVKVMVDTGASRVSIPAGLQAELGLPTGRPVTFTTASDRYEGRATTIRQLVVGPILLRDVAGALNPRSPDGNILLGMSALGRLEMVHRNGTLVLRAPRHMAAGAAPAGEPLKIKRSVRECMGGGKVLDPKALACIRGEGE